VTLVAAVLAAVVNTPGAPSRAQRCFRFAAATATSSGCGRYLTNRGVCESVSVGRVCPCPSLVDCHSQQAVHHGKQVPARARRQPGPNSQSQSIPISIQNHPRPISTPSPVPGPVRTSQSPVPSPGPSPSRVPVNSQSGRAHLPIPSCQPEPTASASQLCHLPLAHVSLPLLSLLVWCYLCCCCNCCYRLSAAIP
jgi:hypothetical protein